MDKVTMDKSSAIPAPGIPDEEAMRIEALLNDVIRTWWSQHIHNSPVAQNTAAYNHLHYSMAALKSELIARLAE